MERKEIAGGWYGEALPSGEYAVAIPSQNKLVSHVGDIPFGPESPLFVRVTNAGGFKLAGQGQDTGRTMEWGGGFWNTKPVACGVSPVIYDQFGYLHISDCSIGSQGWRYVADDGTLVTGDQTYSSPVFHLYEFTTHGDITIGQGGDGGAIAVTPQGRFVLEPGHTTFIRFNRDGNRLAVTIVKLLEAKTVLLWLDASEVASFPKDAPAPPPPPPPPPPPVDPPEPPVSLQAPNEIGTVRRIMLDHPEIDTKNEDTRGAILPYICAALGGKPWGRKSRNAQGTDLNTDALTYLRDDGLFEIYDVISGGNGGATWDGYGPFKQGENGYWVPAADVDEPPDPPDNPPPSPPSDDLARLRAQVEAMNQAIANNFDTLYIRFDELVARVTKLEQAPAGKVPKLRVVVDPKAPELSTGRSIGHSHPIRLAVVPE